MATRNVSSASQISAFSTHGNVTYQNLIAQREMLEISRQVENLMNRADLIARSNLRCRWRDGNGGEPLLHAVDPVSDISSAIRDIASSDLILAPLSDLLGDKPCLFADRLVWNRSSERRPFAKFELDDQPLRTIHVVILLDDDLSGNVHAFLPGSAPRQFEGRMLQLSYNAYSDGGHRREDHYFSLQRWLKDASGEYNGLSPYFR